MKSRRYLKGMLLATVIIITLTCMSCYRWDIYTIEWEVNGSFRQFATSDRENFNTSFLWWDDSSFQSPMMATPVEAEIKKISGYEGGGYGIVFCAQDTENYYLLLITVNQTYAVLECVGGNFNYLKTFSDSGKLLAGYDTPNTVKIEYVGSNTFEISFNGNPPSGSFIDDSFSEGYAGYAVRVSYEGYEILPQIPVDARFRLITPIVDP